MKKKIISLVLATTLVALGIVVGLGSVVAEAAALPTATAEGQTVDVWLIAGQSNAQGCANVSNYPTDSAYAEYKTLLTNGSENTWYIGNTDTAFEPTQFGQGSGTQSGPEIGIATALKNDDGMNAIIKIGYGNTSLYNNTTSNESIKYGTWTSPSYIEKHGVNTVGNRTGDLYFTFIQKVEDGLQQLKDAGYTPVIKGLWFMQGEADTFGASSSAAYAELLETFISDIRADLTEATGFNCAEMPFVYGRIHRNPSYDPTAYLTSVQAGQDAVAAKNIKNVFMMDTTKDLVDPVTGAHRAPVQQDGWHYDTLSQQMIGEKFVSYASSVDGEPTKYGYIPSAYAAAASYPFAIFKNTVNGYVFDSAAATIQAAYERARALTIATAPLTDEAVILLRKNHGDGTYPSNMSDVGATVTLDLNGYTLYPSTALLRTDVDDCMAEGETTQKKAVFNIKNGTLLFSPFGIIFHTTGSTYTTEKTIDLNIDNVKLGFGADLSTKTDAAKYNDLIVSDRNNHATVNVTYDINVTNSTLDFVTNGRADGKCYVGTLYNGTDHGGTSDYVISYRDCTFIASNPESLVGRASTSGDSVTFLQGADGKYGTVKITNPGDKTYVGANGETVVFKATATEGTYDLVASGEIDTAYGKISAAYADAATYPLALFKKSASESAYTFVAGYSSWKTAVSAADDYILGSKGATKEDEAVLLIRRDFYLSDLYTGSSMGGTFTVDLDGNTMTFGTSLMNTQTSDYGTGVGGNTYINIKNGSLLCNTKYGMFYNRISAGSYKVERKYVFTFDNLYIGYAEGGTTNSLLVYLNITNEVSASDAVFTYDMTCNNCTIDMTGAPDGAYIAKLDSNVGAADTYNRFNHNLTFNGGKFVGVTADDIAFVTTDTGDNVFFAKDANGNYPEIVLDSDAPYPTNLVFLNANGEMLVCKTNEVNALTTTYGLKVDNSISTAYGPIAPAYSSSSAYPFAIFVKENGNYTFYKGYSTWKTAAVDAISLTKASLAAPAEEVVILLRADVVDGTYPEQASDIGSTLTVDLGGNFFDCTVAMFRTDVDDCLASGETEQKAATINIKNGSMRFRQFGIIFNTSGSTYTKEKTINLNISDVDFSYHPDAAGITEASKGVDFIISDRGFTSTIDVHYNVKCTGCTFDFVTNARSVARFGNLNSSGGSKDAQHTDYNVEIAGGTIITDDFGKIRFDMSESGDRFVLARDVNGHYPNVLYTEKGEGTHYVVFNGDNEGKDILLTVKYVGVNGNYGEYELVETDGKFTETTAYGEIPAEYVNATTYPWVVFAKNGDGTYTFKSAHTTYSASMDAARALTNATLASPTSEVVLLLRRNSDETAFPQKISDIATTVIVDLNGFELVARNSIGNTQTQDNVLDGNIVPTNGVISFKNGRLLMHSHGAIYLQSAGTYTAGYEKTITFNFDNVYLGFNKGATTKTLIGRINANHTSAISYVNVNFNNCVIDMVTNRSSNSSLQIGNWTAGTDKTAVNVVFNGCQFVVASESDLAHVITADQDSITYGNNVTVILPADAEAPVGKYALSGADGGYAVFVKTSEADGKITYTLTPEAQLPEDVETKYGTIPYEYSSEADYPFVVFKADKTFVGAYTDLGAATLAAKNKGTAGHYYVLMRRNAEQNTKAGGLATVTGSITIDLGGYVLDKTSTGYIFDMYVDDNSSAKLDENGIDARGTFSIINGTVRSTDTAHPLACTNYGEKLKYTYSLNFVFDGVTFIDTDGKCHILDAWENGASKIATDAYVIVNVQFNNCTFDYASSKAGVNMIKLTANNGADRVVYNVEINGGKIISAEPVYFLNFVNADGNTNGRADVVTFGKGSDGNYIQQLLPAGTDTSKYFDTWTDSVGAWHFEKSGTSAGYDVYSLVEGDGGSIEDAPNYTKYGWIPNEYLDATKYPILLFQNGAFVGGYDVYANGKDSGGVMSKVKELLDGSVASEIGKEVFVLLRADAKATGQLPNVGQILGTVNIDLNGFALIQAYNNTTLFYTQAKNWKGMNDCTFNVFNGTVEVKTQILTFGAYGTGYAGGEGMKTFHMNYDNVTFRYAEGSTATQFLGRFDDNSTTAGKSVGYDVEFNNCVFDLRNAPITTLFNANDTKTGESDTNCIINVVVNGGKIITANADILWYEFGTNGSSVTFEKDSEGNLISLVLTASSEKVTNGIVSSIGELAFVKSGTCKEGDVYAPIAKGLADLTFTPKVSITLDRDLILNVYIPVTDALTALQFAGNSIDLGTLEKVELDGVDYYVIRTPLAASLAAGYLPMKATFTVGGASASKSYTFGVIRYAELVFAGNNATEKTLVRNVLSYVRAAYAYFGVEDATAIAAIDAILGENYDENNAYVAEGNTETVTEGFKGVTLVLDATPAIRFYLADGANAEAYEFFVGGNKVNTVTGTDTNGAYVELDVYAYAMIRTVTYTVNGAEGGTYHVNSYYEFVRTDAEHKDNAKLINLVARFAKYCESAAAYRAEVLSALGCSHNYVDGICTECGTADPNYTPDYGTMDITVPSSIYSNYPGRDVTVSFSKEYNGEITYTTDNENVIVENGKIYAKGIFASEVTVTVTATTAHHTATATVKVSTYNGNVSAETKVQYYEDNIIKEENKGGMIFVGDSYVDGYKMSAPPFWRDFYQDYAGKKAFLMGISSSQIHQLEIVSERIVYPMEPSEIVVNIGHNDLHHGSLTVEQFVERLMALLNEYHERLPEAKIYFMGVAPKKTAETNADRFVSSFEKAPAANAAIKALADELDWLYFVDTSSIFYSNGENLVNENAYPGNDASHPSLTSYDLMRLALDKVRGIEHDEVIYINNLNNSVGVNAAGRDFTDANGNPLTTDFAMSGKLVITQLVKNNGHLQFRFGAGPDCRFVLWDNNSDGVFGAGFISGSTSANDKTSGVSLYDATEGLVINWTVILKDGVAYWYINGQLVQTLENLNLKYFNIGAQRINAVLYDIELNVKAEGEAAYNAHVARYADNVNLETYGYGDSNITSKTFTDASGNALTDNFIIKGKLDITAFPKDNVYMQFRFASGFRFLLWDSNNDGKLGAGYTENGTHVGDQAEGILLFDGTNGLTLDWAVVVKNGSAYWYLNGELVKKFASPKIDGFTVGASQMNVLLSDIEIYTKAEDEAAYNAAIANYPTGLSASIEMYENNGDITATGKTFTDESGNALTDNYIVRGTLRIAEMRKGNAHLQFRVGSGCRFLLWDSNGDGVLGVGYMYSGNGSANDKTAGATLYDANNGLTLEWAVVVHEGVAYWYINGELAWTLENPKLDSFNVGAQEMNVYLTNVEICTKAAGKDVYYTELTKYFDNVVNIQKYGQNGDISASGKTFTDASGNNLTNNYIVRGTLDITAVSLSNAHFQFRFGSGCRFLLWDSNSDGVFGVGYSYNGNVNDKTEGAKLLDAKNGLTLEWAIVVNDGVAYWYINGELVQKFDSPKLELFNVGALQMNVFLSDIEVYVKAENADAYNAVLSEYDA